MSSWSGYLGMGLVLSKLSLFFSESFSSQNLFRSSAIHVWNNQGFTIQRTVPHLLSIFQRKVKLQWNPLVIYIANHLCNPTLRFSTLYLFIFFLELIHLTCTNESFTCNANINFIHTVIHVALRKDWPMFPILLLSGLEELENLVLTSWLVPIICKVDLACLKWILAWVEGSLRSIHEKNAKVHLWV